MSRGKEGTVAESRVVMGRDELRTLYAVEAMRRGLPLTAAVLDPIFGQGFARHYEAWREERGKAREQ